MKISIIVPTYNREILLQETLKSIFRQQYTNIEVIVIDDNSTDNTLNMLSSYAKYEHRLNYFNKPSNIPKGPSASRNIGVSKATGDYIHFFDSDDLLTDEFYSTFLNILGTNRPDAFMCRMKWFSGNIANITGTSGKFANKQLFSTAIINNDYLWTQNIIWKSFFLKAENYLFNEQLTMSEDIEFAIRMLTKTNNWLFSNDIYIYVRRHSNSLTLQSSLERECEIAKSRFIAHISIIDCLHKENITSDAKVRCSFIIRQAILFLLKIKGPDKPFRMSLLNGFLYTPAKKWPSFVLGILYNLFLYITKGSTWKSKGGFGRSF